MNLRVNLRSQAERYPGVFLLLFPLLAGCANPGTPRPPSLHLPEVVSDLTADRIGDEVRLHWTTPAKTTDGLNVAGSMTAEICRTAVFWPAPAPACSPVHRIRVQPGPSEIVDQLPPALTSEPQGLIEYKVTMMNSQEHSAGSSSPAFAAAGSAPPPLTGLQVQAAQPGALLRWEPKDAADTIELDRRHTVAQSPRQPDKQPFLPRAQEPDELHIRAGRANEGDVPFRRDAGGTVDATAHRGESYVYTAQRVRKVVLNGHALEIRSAPSASVAVAMRDSFPPKPPAGLEAIATGQTGGLPAIDLSWRPNTEPDLTGYLVYRQELSASGASIGPSARLTASPILEPGFHDTTVVGGHAYSYTVTATDSTGNESAPGAPAREELHLPE